MVEVGDAVRFLGWATLLARWAVLVLGGRVLVEHRADVLKIVDFLRWSPFSAMNRTWHHDLHGLTDRACSAIRLQKEHLLLNTFEVRAPLKTLAFAKRLAVTFRLQN